MTTDAIFTKDADAVLDFKFDWAPSTNGSPGGTSDWLASGESIGTDTGDVVITISPSDTGDLTLDSQALTDSNTSVTIWLSAGVVGEVYTVACKITTDQNRTDEKTIQIEITGITNGYATIQEIKAPEILNFSDNTHDPLLERLIETASRKIDLFCDRFFYQETGTKYYTPERFDELKIDDIYDSTGLTVALDSNRDATYDVSLTSSDWDLWPYNPKFGRPYVKLMMTYLNGYSFYKYPKSVSITSSYWGWSAVPPEVNQACIMIVNRLYKRNQTILGQAGASAIGQITLKIPGFDPDVKELLLPFRKSLT